MFCTSCGIQMQDADRYCGKCGKPAGTPAGAWCPPEAGKRLVRDMSNKMVAGVCAGFADYFGLDITLMRLIWIGLAIWGVGLFLYPIAWMIMPRNDVIAKVAQSQYTAPAVQ